MITAAAVVAAATYLSLFVRAVRRENRRQHDILKRFDRENPIREPGMKRRVQTNEE